MCTDRLGLAFLAIALVGSTASAAHPGAVALGPAGLRSVELVVTDAQGMHKAPILLGAATACGAGQTCLHGSAELHGLVVAVDLGPGGRALPFAIEARAKGPTTVREVTVRMVFSSRSFSLLGRDFRPTRASRAILDRFDPKWIELRDDRSPLASMIVDDDVDSVRVAQLPGAVEVELELLAAPARPFGHLPRCGTHWREIRGRVAVPDRHLHVEDALTAHGELLLGALTPVAVSPWPEGRQAAFVVTDHADQTSATTLHALLGGTSDADLDHASAGLLGHHLAITKALFQRGAFPHGGARPQLEDPQVVALAERARQAGIEIVPHSATPLSDDRKTSEEALRWFGERGAHVWIDHQPQTNREGFCQSGWHTTSGIADLLAKHGYRDVWDLTEWTGAGLDERDPRHLDKRAPTVWPLGRLEAAGPDSLWMFRSTWAFVPTAKFFARYGEAGLDALERDRGLQIAHTYLETLHPVRTFLGRRNVMLRDPDGRVRIDPRLEALFASLQRRQDRGTLWVATMGVVGDRLRALRGVQLRVNEAGALVVTRPAGLADLTVHLGAGVEADASESRAGQRRSESETRAWLQPCPGAPAAPASCTTELRFSQAGAPRSLWQDATR